jgi:hypothetical protein
MGVPPGKYTKSSKNKCYTIDVAIYCRSFNPKTTVVQVC